jgi:hypothetical protein
LRPPLDHAATSRSHPPPRSPRRYRQSQHQRQDQQLQLQLQYPHRHRYTASPSARTVPQITLAATATAASSSSPLSPAAGKPLVTSSKLNRLNSIPMRHLQLDPEQAPSSSSYTPPIPGSASFLNLDSPSLASANAVEQMFRVGKGDEQEEG